MLIKSFPLRISPADLVTFTEEILNENFIFLCSFCVQGSLKHRTYTSHCEAHFMRQIYEWESYREWLPVFATWADSILLVSLFFK